MEQKRKKIYVSPRIEKIEFEDDDIIITSAGNGDVNQGRGRGGGTPGGSRSEERREKEKSGGRIPAAGRNKSGGAGVW